MPAFGQFQHPRLPRYNVGAGIGTELATIIGGGEVVAYVHSSGRNNNNSADINERLYTTLNGALNKCRASRGDTVVVLPGHAENISSADQMSALVAGTRIIGLGYGTIRPKFTWTAATATFLFDVANTSLSNCVLEMAGDPASTTALSVAAPITVSAAGCSLVGCLIRVGVDADQLATIGITTTAAGDDFSIVNCWIHGATTSEVTTAIRLVGADRFYMSGCYVYAATSSTTVGVLQMATTASLNVLIEDSVFVNTKASSAHAATGMAAATGVVSDCKFGILDDATLQGFDTEGNLQFFNCEVSNLAGEEAAEKAPKST